MRDFLIQCGYPAERADMILGDMKPYHRPEWWVFRQPADLYYWSPRVQKLKSDGVIKGIYEVYFVDIHYLRTDISWAGNACNLLLIPHVHYVDPLDYRLFEAWVENDGGEQLLDIERELPYNPEDECFDKTIPLKAFAILNEYDRRRRFHWTDNQYTLEETVGETFESTWEYERGNPTY